MVNDTLCQLVDVEPLADGRVLRRCSVCNWQTTTAPGLPVHRRCGRPRPAEAKGENPLPLGDWLDGMLSSVGVTKERYKEAKKLFGLPPTCNCPERQAWLNRVGAWAAGLVGA